MSDNGWTRDVPTKPGVYWFTGYHSRFAKQRGIVENNMFITVVKGGKSLMAHSRGEFIYFNETEGWWREVELPPPAPPMIST